MISFVYFDLGGVVIKDFSGTDQWTEMKKVIGVEKSYEKEFDELYDKYELSELCLTRDVDTLIPIFAKKFGRANIKDKRVKAQKNKTVLFFFKTIERIAKDKGKIPI